MRFFGRWHGVQHSRDMGPRQVEAFLTMLAAERKASASTHNQALSALLFLYREVLAVKGFDSRAGASRSMWERAAVYLSTPRQNAISGP